MKNLIKKKITYFRRKIFRRSAKSLSRVSEGDVLLAQAEVGNLDVAILVKKQIFELKGTNYKRKIS